MRIVADTNTLVSGLIWHSSPHHVVNAARGGKLQLVTSAILLAELVNVLNRDKLARPLRQAGLIPERLAANVGHLAYVVEPAALSQPICRDPKDDAVLATALAGKVEMIVSGDKDLLVLGQFEGIPILTATQALAHIT